MSWKQMVAVALAVSLRAGACPAATQHPLIYGFDAPSQGASPSGPVIGVGQNLYGTTLLGGASCSFNPQAGCGVVYQLSPPAQGGGAWTETVLHSFVHYFTQGAEPVGGVIADSAGNLYGTTVFGGQNGQGTVWRLSPPAAGQKTWTETLLHSFAGGTDGTAPQAGLVADAQGALYGTTYYSNAQGGCGTVFRLTQAAGAWTLTPLYTFSGKGDGCHPQAALIIDSAGVLYGTTTGAGKSTAPTAFALTPPGGGGAWTEATLHAFAGASPSGALSLAPSGVLYGMTATGGGTACRGGCGTVFSLTPANGGWTFDQVYAFQGQGDGRHPTGALAIDAAGNLYGATAGRLSPPGGGVFELVPTAHTWLLVTLFHFTNNADGAVPNAGVTLDASGNVYGTMLRGGAYGGVFRVVP